MYMRLYGNRSLLRRKITSRHYRMGLSEQILRCWKVKELLGTIGRLIFLDRHYEEEPSGCTATAVLITDKNVLYVVCFLPLLFFFPLF